MIGQKEAFEYLADGNNFKSVYVMVGDKPSWFNPKDQDLALPSIYTQKRKPQPIDLLFLKGQKIQLIHAKNASDELFASWYIHLVNLKPKWLVAIDSAEEFHVYN